MSWWWGPPNQCQPRDGALRPLYFIFTSQKRRQQTPTQLETSSEQLKRQTNETGTKWQKTIHSAAGGHFKSTHFQQFQPSRKLSFNSSTITWLSLDIFIFWKKKAFHSNPLEIRPRSFTGFFQENGGINELNSGRRKGRRERRLQNSADEIRHKQTPTDESCYLAATERDGRRWEWTATPPTSSTRWLSTAFRIHPAGASFPPFVIPSRPSGETWFNYKFKK